MTHPPAGTSFHVDMERAADAIQELKDALEELKDIKLAAGNLAKVDPGSGDSVSIDAARVFGSVAMGGPGDLTTALDVGIAHLQDLISNLTSELNEYRRTDRTSSRSFGGPGPA